MVILFLLIISFLIQLIQNCNEGKIRNIPTLIYAINNFFSRDFQFVKNLTDQFSIDWSKREKEKNEVEKRRKEKKKDGNVNRECKNGSCE